MTRNPPHTPFARSSRIVLLGGLLGGSAVIGGAILALTLAGCRRDRELPPEIPRLVQQTLSDEVLPAAERQQKERARAWSELRSFYQKRAFAPAWSDGAGPLPRADELVKAIAVAAPEGLEPRRYNGPLLEQEIAALRQSLADRSADFADPGLQHRLVDLDVTLSYTFLTLAAHLATGRQQPGTLRTGWYTEPRKVDYDGLLAQAVASHDPDALGDTLKKLTPPGEGYRHLRDALARYREIDGQGGWPEVPAGPALARGATGPRVAALRARLAAEGDLARPAAAAAGQAPSGEAFDDVLAAAVARFQRRHGLEPTGAVDADTLEALNVPAAERARQIEVNMERWRWLPSDLGKSYILVNVPEYTLRIFEADRQTLTMRVIVGKEQSQTPVFSDQMTYLELNPAWNLPSSIVRNEVLPALAKDPSYLARKNMELVRDGGGDSDVVDASTVDLAALGNGSPYRLRQRPGPDNPLGRIKFMFPNEFDVYLHDTPADHLFNREERDFSHGCIRVEFPTDLAAYLLRADPKWSRQALEEALASGERRSITLPRPLPVHILYWTAWVDADGAVQFRKDIYGHDGKLAKDLAKEPPLRLELGARRGEQHAALRRGEQHAALSPGPAE